MTDLSTPKLSPCRICIEGNGTLTEVMQPLEAGEEPRPTTLITCDTCSLVVTVTAVELTAPSEYTTARQEYAIGVWNQIPPVPDDLVEVFGGDQSRYTVQ